MEHDAHTALMEMLTTTAAGPDLARVLGSLAGQRPVLDALVEGLGPVVSTLLQVTLGLGGRAAAGTVSLGQAEEELRTSGRDLMRATLQAVVDAASAAQERVPGGVDGPEGVRRTRVEDGHARTVATMFGRITVDRLAYRAPHVGNVHPLDGVLDLPEGLYSTGLARLSAREATRGSFVEASDAVEYVTGVRIGTCQLIELTRAGKGVPGPVELAHELVRRRPLVPQIRLDDLQVLLRRRTRSRQPNISDGMRGMAQRCRPHSVLVRPAQRPARPSSPGRAVRVQGAHPMEG